VRKFIRRYVARSKRGGGYACEGDTSCSIDHCKRVSDAKLFYGPSAISQWMGGHYKGYEAVPVKISYDLGAAEEIQAPVDD